VVLKMSVKSKGGVCDVCGCTFEKPCIDEIFGCCRWMNFDRTICSYCFWKLDEEEKRRYDDY